MNILVIAPHADDEILGAGGTLARLSEEGHAVHVCVVTCGHPSMFPEEMRVKLRKEALCVHEMLKVRKTFFLDFPAVMLADIPAYEVNARILSVVKEVKPDIAFIPHCGDMHLDHYIVAQSAMVALRPIDSFKVKEIYSYETLSETEWNVPHARNTFLPTLWVDISGFLNRKLEAMSTYATQLHAFPHPRSLEAIEALARLRGTTVGTEAAEAFCLIRRIL